MRGRYYLWMAATATAYFLGIGTGILLSKNWMERKYKRIADEEIESVKKTFARKKEAAPDVKSEMSDENNTAQLSIFTQRDAGKYAEILRETGYSGEDEDAPYIISPDEFGEKGGYDQISLTYFADGVLTDENYYPMEDADELIGEDALNHFGEYEEDSVFVRNDAMRTDFEILLDQRRYSDVRRTMPPQ